MSEQVSLAPIIQQVGAIEESRVDEAVSALGRLLTTAIKDAKTKHGPNKRVRVFLTLDAPTPDTALTEGREVRKEGNR